MKIQPVMSNKVTMVALVILAVCGQVGASAAAQARGVASDYKAFFPGGVPSDLGPDFRHDPTPTNSEKNGTN